MLFVYKLYALNAFNCFLVHVLQIINGPYRYMSFIFILIKCNSTVAFNMIDGAYDIWSKNLHNCYAIKLHLIAYEYSLDWQYDCALNQGLVHSELHLLCLLNGIYCINHFYVIIICSVIYQSVLEYMIFIFMAFRGYF